MVDLLPSSCNLRHPSYYRWLDRWPHRFSLLLWLLEDPRSVRTYLEVPYPSAQVWRFPCSLGGLWELSKTLTRQWGLHDVHLVYKGSLISTSSIENPCPPNRLQGSLISTSSIKAPSSPSLLQHVFGSFLQWLLEAPCSFKTPLGVSSSFSLALEVSSLFSSSIGAPWYFSSSMGLTDVQLIHKGSLTSSSSSKPLTSIFSIKANWASGRL